jgi:hypothetical protein
MIIIIKMDDYIIEVISVERVVYEGDEARGAVVGVEDEDVVVRATLNGLVESI